MKNLEELLFNEYLKVTAGKRSLKYLLIAYEPKKQKPLVVACEKHDTIPRKKKNFIDLYEYKDIAYMDVTDSFEIFKSSFNIYINKTKAKIIEEELKLYELPDYVASVEIDNNENDTIVKFNLTDAFQMFFEGFSFKGEWCRATVQKEINSSQIVIFLRNNDNDTPEQFEGAWRWMAIGVKSMLREKSKKVYDEFDNLYAKKFETKSFFDEINEKMESYHFQYKKKRLSFSAGVFLSDSYEIKNRWKIFSEIQKEYDKCFLFVETFKRLIMDQIIESQFDTIRFSERDINEIAYIEIDINCKCPYWDDNSKLPEDIISIYFKNNAETLNKEDFTISSLFNNELDFIPTVEFLEHIETMNRLIDLQKKKNQIIKDKLAEIEVIKNTLLTDLFN